MSLSSARRPVGVVLFLTVLAAVGVLTGWSATAQGHADPLATGFTMTALGFGALLVGGGALLLVFGRRSV